MMECDYCPVLEFVFTTNFIIKYCSVIILFCRDIWFSRNKLFCEENIFYSENRLMSAAA